MKLERHFGVRLNSIILLFIILKNSLYSAELLKFIHCHYWGSGHLLWEIHISMEPRRKVSGSVLLSFKSRGSLGVEHNSVSESDMWRGYLQEAPSTCTLALEPAPWSWEQAQARPVEDEPVRSSRADPSLFSCPRPASTQSAACCP